MTYRVQLESFHGPMDLLLYLVRKNEVELSRIPIATIADQFLEYLELMESLDIEYAAEFLVMAATLMDLKAKSLVPQLPDEEDEEDEELVDPREELIRELIEYKRTRDAAGYLEERLRARTRKFESGASEPELDERPIEEVEVWDLFSAFSRLLDEIGAGSGEIVSKELPLDAYIKMILARLGRSGRLSFRELFVDAGDRAAVVGMFAALLELVRLKRLRAFQEREFGEITLELRGEESAAEGEEFSSGGKRCPESETGAPDSGGGA